MKVSINRENSNWILDEIADDYKTFSNHNVVENDVNSDLFWFINPWTYRKPNCKSVISIHHIDESKIAMYPFKIWGQADACIVPNMKTARTVQKYMNIKIYKIPYWLISKRTNFKDDKSNFNETLIGSFQKDSEGNTDKPKLSKGPDIFLKVIEELNKSYYNIRVILSGYNRRYLINEFEKRNINYSYYERVDNINSLYGLIDWYFVTSRTEGGPQSVLESSYRKVKILSTDVGMASDVLHPDCICKDVGDFVSKFKNGLDRTKENFENVSRFSHVNVISKIDELFVRLYENN